MVYGKTNAAQQNCCFNTCIFHIVYQIEGFINADVVAWHNDQREYMLLFVAVSISQGILQ